MVRAPKTPFCVAFAPTAITFAYELGLRRSLARWKAKEKFNPKIHKPKSISLARLWKSEKSKKGRLGHQNGLRSFSTRFRRSLTVQFEFSFIPDCVINHMQILGSNKPKNVAIRVRMQKLWLFYRIVRETEICSGLDLWPGRKTSLRRRDRRWPGTRSQGC